MKCGRIIVAFVVVGVLSGCGTIFRAREAQRAMVARELGVHEGQKGSRIDLSDYSLRELVDFALTNRPAMVSAALAVADARLGLREIAADAPLVSYSPWTSPHLGLSGGYSASSTPSSPIEWKTEGNVSAGLSLDILIYDFGRNRARAEAQVENVIAAEYDFVRAGYTVFDEVADNYFGLMERDALLEVALTNETECALRLRQAEDRFAAGEAKRLDVTAAKLDLSQAHEQTIGASNDVVIAGAQLMTALGIDISRGTRDEVFPATGKALAQVMRGFADTSYGVEEAFELARTNSPVMAIARARLRAASASVDYAIADLMPSVSAEVGISWADPLWAWHWGVSFAQSIFQGHRKTLAVDRAVVSMRSAAAAVDEAEQQLSQALEAAIAVRDNAVKRLETARDSVVNALENLNTTKSQYHEGDASRVDYTIALSQYATTLGSRVSAFYTGQRAEMKLFALTGRMPEYQEEIVKEK